MKKIFYLIILIINVIFIGAQESATNVNKFERRLKMKKIDSLISQNDSLSLIYYRVVNDIDKEKLDSLLTEYENKRISNGKLQIYLMALSIFGNEMVFLDRAESKKWPQMETFEDLIKLKSMIPKYQSGSNNKDGTLKKSIIARNDGEVIIIEQNKDGKYIKKRMDKNGIITFEEINEVDADGMNPMNIEISKE